MSNPFLENNKMKILSNVPHTRMLSHTSLRGIKHFKDFEKADFKFKIETVTTRSYTTTLLKYKVLKWTPHGF